MVPATLEAEVGGLLKPQEVEAAVNYDCITALQHVGQSETLSQKQKEKKERKTYTLEKPLTPLQKETYMREFTTTFI